MKSHLPLCRTIYFPTAPFAVFIFGEELAAAILRFLSADFVAGLAEAFYDKIDVLLGMAGADLVVLRISAISVIGAR